jgi:hypothetical protein
MRYPLPEDRTLICPFWGLAFGTLYDPSFSICFDVIFCPAHPCSSVFPWFVAEYSDAMDAPKLNLEAVVGFGGAFLFFCLTWAVLVQPAQNLPVIRIHLLLKTVLSVLSWLSLAQLCCVPLSVLR